MAMATPRAPRLELVLTLGAAIALAVGAVELATAIAAPDTVPTSDFAVFRAGGALVGGGHDPYDRAAQQDIMRALLGVEREGGHLAFLLPPHGALFFLPFAHLPLELAFGLWAALAALLLARLATVVADLAHADLRVVALVVASLGPVHASFRLGQLAIVCALALAELARALRDDREVAAGLALAALSLKPQFLPVALAFVAGLGRWRVLGAALLAFAGLALPTLWAPGPSSWLAWARGLGALEEAFAVATPPYMVNARGVLARILGDPAERAQATRVAWALFALAAAAGLVLGRHARRWAAPGIEAGTRVRARSLALALALALALLFSPHLFFHDLCAWSVPAALARGATAGVTRRRWDLLALGTPSLFLAASAIEPALGFLLPVPPQLAAPLAAIALLAQSPDPARTTSETPRARFFSASR